MSVLTHFPENRLAVLLDQFGGVSRKDAIAAALRELDILRPEADEAIQAATAQMEEILREQAKSGEVSAELMKRLLPPSDQVVTLAGTYGYDSLGKATRSLCDLLDGLLRAKKNDLASIRAHVQVVRLMAPGSAPLTADHIDVMLSELTRLLAYHGVAPLKACEEINSEDG
jgi:hypothetical protein